MIVYGDGHVRLTVSDVAEILHKRLSAPAKPSPHELRIRCAIAGQLEQSAIDSSSNWAPEAEALSMLCGHAFAARVLGVSWPNSNSPEGWDQAARILFTISSRAKSQRPSYPMKIPEGFAWYAVYPDAYVQAALAWARAARTPSSVTVIGLRSIGTTLSAVVAAALRLRGFAVNRITVRPKGDPYRRHVGLPPELPINAAALVVDEGPGRSGSSIAATGDALVRHGFDRNAIVFLPAHTNGPGGEASASIEQWWRKTAIHVGVSIRPGKHHHCDCIEMGGGLWMGRAGVSADDVHAAAPMLEAPKFITDNGTCTILWKFSGFTLAPNRNATLSEHTSHKLTRLADLGLVPCPKSCEDGWIGTPWVDGPRLALGRLTALDVLQACDYIRAAADPPLQYAEAEAARERLADLLIANAKELWPSAINSAQRAADTLLNETRLHDLSSYGDGRLAPHEWARMPSGELLKLDAGGHSCDHTAIGPQTILWDVAGLMVEWNVHSRIACDLLDAFKLSADLEKALACYVAAYAAFRAGVATLCGAQESQQRAIAYYTAHLTSALNAI